MEISFLGHASFKIREKEATVVTDPFLSSMVGFKFPSVNADIVTVSHQHEDHNAVSMVGGDFFVVDSPGEYEIKGVSIFGYETNHDNKNGSLRGKNNIYLIETGGLRICHLGDLGEELSSEIMEELGEVDVLMIPVGGEYTIGPKEAISLIGQVEPKIVLPMHFKEAGMKEEVFGKLLPVEKFLEEFGKEPERLERLVVNKEKLPEETTVVLLSRRS